MGKHFTLKTYLGRRFHLAIVQSWFVKFRTYAKPPFLRGVGGILELRIPTFWLRLRKS